jgi:ferredoxin
MTIRNKFIACLGLLPAWLAQSAAAVQRFSQPEFEGGHKIPMFQIPPLPAGVAWEYLDVLLLTAALGLGVWLVHRRRSRAGMFALMLACLAYFGFIRKGCICPIGAIQNVAASLGQADYSVPVPVLLFFLLPLVVALFFGRVFCGAVCPLGAIQDLMIVGRIKPLPRWLAAGLSLFRHAYLGLSVLLAALGAGFIICEYDPFVGFFRLSGPVVMLVAGGVMLALGVFVARPYCRFLCPYGALLELAGRFAWRQVVITPYECVACGLCTESCPFDAIATPSGGVPPDGLTPGRKVLMRRLILVPVILVLCLTLGRAAATSLANLHPTVRLAGELQVRAANAAAVPAETVQAFDENAGDSQAVLAEARAIVARFRIGAPLLGLFLGSVVCIALLGLATYRTRTVFRPDPGRCLACTRCYGHCPVTRAKGAKHGPDATAG